MDHAVAAAAAAQHGDGSGNKADSPGACTPHFLRTTQIRLPFSNATAFAVAEYAGRSDGKGGQL